MAIAPDSAYADMLAQKKKAPAPKAPTKLEPTVTIGGAPAGYRPVTAASETAKTQAAVEATKAAEKAAAEKATAETAAAAAKTAAQTKAAGEKLAEDTGLSAAQIQDLVKSYTSDVLSRMSQEEKTAERLSAYNILKMEFDQYGLGSLVTDIKDLLINNTPTSEFGLRLRGTDAYKARFKANEARIAAGLAALSPAEYVALEDQYQNVMRNYGLPASYYTKDITGKQVGFEKFIAGDVSATELEDRIATAQKRVLNANPEVSTALKAFYPDITNGDILAYALDPSQGLEGIKRKVTAAEIGGAAIAQGLQTGALRAEELAGYGVTKAQAQEGYQTAAGIVPRAQQLSGIYKQDQYDLTRAEQEIFGLAGAAEATQQRKKLVGLEKAAFSGSAGAAQGALGRERAMGQGQF